ncbi:MAG: hypothetical protein P1T08_07745 [Acidimicrobiia bacterium]|nr:hypothetical protein [Acidimicrobiia bacterium]
MNELMLMLQPGVEPLLEILRRERDILESLLARLRQVGELVLSHPDRSLASAARQVSNLEDQLGTTEMMRALIVAGIAEEWHINDYDLSLRTIISRGHPDHAQALGQRLDELVALTNEIDSLRPSLEQSTRERLEAAQLGIERLAGTPLDG